MSWTGAQLLYLVFALGAVGVYFLLPRSGTRGNYAGIVLGILALAAWLVVMATRFIAPGTSGAMFLFCAAIAIVATARVISHPKPFYSAIYFVLTVVAVTALLVLQRAEFLAASLIIIYAGAILVTYLFLIMLAQQSGAPVYDRRAREPFAAVFGGFLLMAVVAARAETLPTPVADAAAMASVGNTKAVGVEVITRYVVALQIAGVLLLVSMIGAVALSRKRVVAEHAAWAAPSAPLGQAGREAGPY